MKKNVFISSFLTLLVSCFLSRFLSIINRIIIARFLGSEAIGLYMLVLPTVGLFIAFAQMGLPTAVTKLIADKNYNNKKVMFTAIMISMLNNIIIVVSLAFLVPYVGSNLLNNTDTIPSLYMILPFILLVSGSGLIKNYFYGIANVKPPAISDILEEISRLMFTIVMLNVFANVSIPVKTSLIVLAMSIGELVSLIFLFFSIQRKKKIKIKKSNFTFSNFIYKDVLSISIPNTSSRLINSFNYFLEPIIVTSGLLGIGMTTLEITKQYGIISGYVLPILSIPSFITMALHQILLPTLTRAISFKEYGKAKKTLLSSVYLCLAVGVISCTILYNFPEQSLKLMYNTTEGASYLKYLAIPFIICFLQTPFAACLQALSKNKTLMIISMISNFIQSLSLFILLPNFGILSVAIANVIYMLLSVLLHGFYTYKYLFFKQK